MVAGNLLGVVSGLLKATSAGYHSDQSRSAADAPGRAGQSTFLVSSLRGTGTRSRRSGPRLENRRRIVGIRRRVAAAVACPSPRVSGLLLPLRFARYAASRSARSGKKPSPPPLYLGSLWRTSRPEPRGRYAGSWKAFVAWPLLLESRNWEVW